MSAGIRAQRRHQHPGDLERRRFHRDVEHVVAVRVQAEQRDALLEQVDQLISATAVQHHHRFP